jgi:hypothetical protein
MVFSKKVGFNVSRNRRKEQVVLVVGKDRLNRATVVF